MNFKRNKEYAYYPSLADNEKTCHTFPGLSLNLSYSNNSLAVYLMILSLETICDVYYMLHKHRIKVLLSVNKL